MEIPIIIKVFGIIILIPLAAFFVMKFGVVGYYRGKQMSKDMTEEKSDNNDKDEKVATISRQNKYEKER